MANKQTIQDIDEALDRWHRKLTLCVTRINELRDKKKRIRKGQLKQPPPPGIKVKIGSTMTPEQLGELNDPIPSFGSTPALGG